MFVQIFLGLGVRKISPMKHHWRLYEFQAALIKNVALSLFFRSIFAVLAAYCTWKKERSTVGSVVHTYVMPTAGCKKVQWGFLWKVFNPLKTKRRLLYLKNQFVPRSKHFSSRLKKPISLCCKWHESLFVLR